MARNFPNFIQAYMEHTRASESPDVFHLWTAISTVAAALQRRVWIDQLAFQWTPNMYIVLVGPPGIAAKSTTMKNGARLLGHVKGVTIGPEVTSWQMMLKLMEDASSTLTLGEQKYQYSCVTFQISEFGAFFRADSDEFISVLIDLYDAQYSAKPWVYATKTAGVTTVMNPWINLIACTTPTWLQENYGEKMIGGGLTSRIIFIYGDKKRQLVAYPARQIRVEDYKEREARLIEDLQLIATMGGEMHLTEEGYEWGTEWYRKHYENRPPDMASDRFNGYLARKQAHLHKLAIICSAAHSGSREISLYSLKQAEMLLTMAEKHMQHVFRSIGMVQEARATDTIVALVRHYGSVTPEALWQLCRAQMKRMDYDAALLLALNNEQRIARATVAGELRYVPTATAEPAAPPVVSP